MRLEPVLLVMAGYAATLVGLGIAFARYSASTAAIYRADNQVPWGIAGLSQFMASHSAYMFVVAGGMFYGKGSFGLLWFALTQPIIMALGAWCFGRRWHRTGVSTPVEYLEARFGSGVRQFFARFGLLVRPLNNGVRMAAFGVIMAAVLGLDSHAPLWLGLSAPAWIAVAGIVLVLTYTLLGGLMGAVVVDAVQFVIMETALIALFCLSWRACGGMAGLAAKLPPHFLSLPPLHDSAWLWLAGWGVLQFADTGAAQWGLITRFLCTRTDNDARKVGFLAAAMYVPLIALIGLPVFYAKTQHPSIDPEASFGWVSRALLPPGLLALMIAALFSATLATISAELNTLSGVVTLDIYRRRFRPLATDRDLVRFGRRASIVLALAFAVVALLVLGGAPTILRATQEISSLFVAPLAVSLLGGLFTSRSGQTGVYLSVLLGVGASIAARIAGRAFAWPEGALVLAQNGGAALVSIAALWWDGRRAGAPAARSTAAESMLRRIRQGSDTPAPPPGAYPAPLPLIGGGVLAIAAVQAGTLLFPQASNPETAWTAAGLAALGVSLVALGRFQRE